MKLNFLKILQFLTIFCITFFKVTITSEVQRNLVLTPREEYQLNGQTIYYPEEDNVISKDQLIRPWERTLKHVTFVTLFTNSAANAAAGNMSKLREYSQFLHSDYVRQPSESDSRFGDIATLASGYLQVANNGTYRFVEGSCDFDCDAENIWALWRVQKIRHRDKNRVYRYEIKFSISPLHFEFMNNENSINTHRPITRKTAQHNYIQRDEDYPQSFNPIIYAQDNVDAERKMDERQGRSFRQVMTGNYNQATPIPQQTFMHGVFQPFPPMPQEKLNIGEYFKRQQPKSTPRLGIFQNVPGFLLGSPFATPTTYRPTYQVKLPRPELYRPLADEIKIHMHPNDNIVNRNKIPTQMITHHFHHHFFMPNENDDNVDRNAVPQLRSPTNNFQEEIAETTPQYFNNIYRQPSFPLKPQESFIEKPVDVEIQQIVQVTPVPPIKKPQIYSQLNYDTKAPLFIYPAPVDEEPPTLRNKPFIQSEPINTEPIRYSEPDPLYINLDPKHEDQNYDPEQIPQIETPQVSHYEVLLNKHFNDKELSAELQTDADAAQISTSSDRDQNNSDVTIEDNLNDINDYGTKNSYGKKSKYDSEQKPSKKKFKISPENPIDIKNIKNDKQNETTTISTPAGATESATSLPVVADNVIKTINAPTKPTEVTITESANDFDKNAFVSTSTTVRPLKAIARKRGSHMRHSNTSTTTQPVLKWKPKRRAHHPNRSTITKHDSKAKGSTRHEQQVPPELTEQIPNKDTTTMTTPTQLLTKTTPVQQVNANVGSENYEVLTQKSVSKSVSIRVGEDGKELPVAVDDENGNAAQNEIKNV